MPNTTNSATDPNAILFEYNPSGASFATAKQDGLAQKGIVGPQASRRMAASDAARILPHKEKFAIAAQQSGVPPALLAAIASRESRGGGVLDKKGFGDHGMAFGLMQVDKRFHQLDGLPDPTSLQHIIQAAGILAGFRDAVAKKHVDWHEERQLQGAVAAYNSGLANIQTLDGMDKGTTGNDYSNDVWARALFFAEQTGSVAPSTPSTTVASLQPLNTMLTPAPALAEVEAGTSVLQRNQRGEAVATLQQSLLGLSYLELSEEEKATGIGIFGPKTEGAVQSFQRDVYLPPSGVYDVVTHHGLRQILDQAVKRDADNQIGIVRRLQDRLVALEKVKGSDVAKAYGTFGPKTEGAVKDFQKEKGFEQGGVLTVETFLALRASAPNAPPALDLGSGDDTLIESQLPNAGPGFFAKGGATQRSTQFCTERTLNRLKAFAAVWMSKHPDRPLRIGEMSIEGGGKFGAHVGEGHRSGFAVDIGLFSKDGQNLGITFRDAVYDRALTRELATSLSESPNVFLIIFNDPEVTVPKLTRDSKHIHDNHLHVEFRKQTGK